MANWVTLPNGVHIDLDDPNNPIASKMAGEHPYKETLEGIDVKQINISTDGRICYRQRFGGKEILRDREAVGKALKDLGIISPRLKDTNDAKEKVIDYLKNYSPEYKSEEKPIKSNVIDDKEEYDDNEWQNNYERSVDDFKKNLDKQEIDVYDSVGIIRDVKDYLLEGGTSTYDFKSGWYLLDIDVEGDSDGGNGNFNVYGITNYKEKIEDLANEYGVELEFSKRSESFYFEKDGKSYRISDHKMPLVVESNWDRNDDVDVNFVEKSLKARFDKFKQILEKK